MERNLERATATGLLNSTIGVSSIAGPIIGGTLVTASLAMGLPPDSAYRTTFYAAAIMALIALATLPYINGRKAIPGPAS
jgi:MFS family permease